VKKPATPPVKGRQQLAGGAGTFGTVYSLKRQFNFAILAARYQVEPFVAPGTLVAETGEKLLVLDIAIKNTKAEDHFFDPDGLFTLVDSSGTQYTDQSTALTSKGAGETNLTLRPGQGMGQAELKDPLRIAFRLPASARIVKIMVDGGRAGTQEETLRYFVAGATRAEAGEAGDPRNSIAPLPENLKDPKDPSGAVPLAEGKGARGVFLPSGHFGLRLDSFTYSTSELNGMAPEDGKRWAVATLTARLLTPGPASMFEVSGGDDPLFELTDADGERVRPAFFRRARQDQDPEKDFRPGEEYAFRVVFAVPKDAAVKRLVIGTGRSRKWSFEAADLK